MKTKLIYITILTLLLAIFVCLYFRGTPSTPRVSENTENFVGDGMPPNLMTPQPHSDADFNDLMNLIETTIPDEWLSTDSPMHRVRTNDLIEVDENEGDYVLSMQLFRHDQVLATQNRYFASHPGPDGEIDDRPLSYLACAMFSNGFLSGSCEIVEISNTEVSVVPDWTFDDRDANVESKFDQSFMATLGETGTAECSDGATIKWEFEDKSTEQRDAPKPPKSAF